MKVAILGGGINGLCCGVQIKEKCPSADVTIISECLSPNTTGDGSAGLWGPYLMGSTAPEKAKEWSLEMHNFLKEIWLSEVSGEAGVCLIPVTRVTTNETKLDDFWKDIVYGLRTMKKTELDASSGTRFQKFKSGLHFVTFTSEPVKLLPYLEKRFELSGGNVLTNKICDLDEFLQYSEFDVTINCIGLGARFLVNDNLVQPIRGQVSRVKADWVYYVTLDESHDGNYIIPK